MRKFTKKTFCILTAAVMSVGALSLTACGNGFSPVAEDKSGNVESNGGFVVATNDYYYFINGMEDYTADNTYGDVVKGALMRVKKTEVKENKYETVIPSLFASGDYDAGVYIYNNRIYYATPNNVKNTSGVVESDYLDFKSAKTDGSDVTDILRVESNSLQYRYIESGEGAEKIVYLVYVKDKELHSYNTETGADTLLVKDGTYLFNDADKTDPYVYYTMSVADKQDSDYSVSYKYNQIYRVRADVTEGPEYTWNQEWLDENNEGKAPYVNLGQLVLDGIGQSDLGMEDKDNAKTQFNPDAAEDLSNCPAIGYVYTLQNYTNDGIYFKRALTYTPGSTVGSEGELYYLPASALTAEWNTVDGNSGLDMVANSINLSKASSSALFYLENGEHHYLYVSGSNIYRADVNKKDGSNQTKDLAIAHSATGATLVSLDATSDETYHYVYYTLSNSGGLSVERAVYNGTEKNYSNLVFGDAHNEPYEPVKLLNVQHASGWYEYEIIDNNLFYANYESFNAPLNYIYTVNLNGADGTLLNNEELSEINEKYDAIFSTDSKKGYLEKVKVDVSTDYSNALKYYFYTGESELFWENIEDARKAGKNEKYINKNLYSLEQQKLFAAFTGGEDKFEGLEKSEDLQKFYDENEQFYFSLGYFTTMLGEMKESDADEYRDYWKTSVLKTYVEEAEEDGESLAWWAWLLIALAIAAVVVGAVFGAKHFRKRKASDAPKPERMRVDTTDDKDVDVYNTAENQEPAEEPEASEAHEEVPAEEVIEAEENAAEEFAEEPEQSSEENAEASEEPAETAEEPVPEADENDPYHE